MQGEERRGKTAYVVTTLNNTKHTERPQEVAWARPKGKHTAEESVWFEVFMQLSMALEWCDPHSKC